LLLDKILTELKAERDRLTRAIAALEGANHAPAHEASDHLEAERTADERCGAQAPQ